MKLVWTEPAVEDLRELHAYIARDSELYASGFVNRIISATEGLAARPNMGRAVPEANDDTVRELLYQNYRIIYRVTSNRVELLSVVHGSRDIVRGERARWDLS